MLRHRPSHGYICSSRQRTRLLMLHFSSFIFHRFPRVALKGDPLKIGAPATDDEIANLFENVREIDGSVQVGKMKKTDLKNCDKLLDYKKNHMRERRYMFQIKKCEQSPLNARLKRECLHVCLNMIIYIC